MTTQNDLSLTYASICDQPRGKERGTLLNTNPAYDIVKPDCHNGDGGFIYENPDAFHPSPQAVKVTSTQMITVPSIAKPPHPGPPDYLIVALVTMIICGLLNITSMFFGVPAIIFAARSRYNRTATRNFKHARNYSNIALGLIIACIIYTLLWAIILTGITAGTNEGAATNTETSPADTVQSVTTKLSKSSRLMSLDAFRGFSLVIMIFVNYGGGGYWFFNHSKWNGLTVADVVFPWFVWIMGVSVVFSFKGQKKDSIWKRLYQVVRRSVILFGLGLFLNSDDDNFDLTTWRIPGVLQRFAISYFVVAMVELFTSELYRIKGGLFTCWDPIADLTNNWVQWIFIITLELVWLIVTFLLTTNGCPWGYLSPGGISDWGNYQNCTGGAAGIIDRWFFTEAHIYQHPTAQHMYNLTLPYDPEGILGSLNSIVICFLGVQAGRILTLFRGRHIGIIVRLSIWGVILGVISALLCEGQADTGLIPINKNLWSLSYILAMAGSGFVLLALFYLLIDVLHLWNGSPFKYPGMNSILIYVCHEVLEGYFPFQWPHQEDSHLIYLSANLVAIGLWMLIAFYCYLVGFYVKI